MFVPLAWTFTERGTPFLVYLDLAEFGSEYTLPLQTERTPDPSVLPRFSPGGKYVALAMRGDHENAPPLTEIFQRSDGRRVVSVSGWLPATRPAWSPLEDAVVIETPGEVVRVALPGGERVAVAQRGRPGMPPLVYYGCNRGGRLVMGPPLPARGPVVFRTFPVKSVN